MQTLDGWLSVMSFDLADSAFNNQWFMQIKKNGQIKHQTDMTQTRLSKTNIRVNWGKESRPSVWPQFLFSKKSNFISKIEFLFRKCHFYLKSTNFEADWGFLKHIHFETGQIFDENAHFKIKFKSNSTKCEKILFENCNFSRNHEREICDFGKKMAITGKWLIFDIFVSQNSPNFNKYQKFLGWKWTILMQKYT